MNRRRPSTFRLRGGRAFVGALVKVGTWNRQGGWSLTATGFAPGVNPNNGRPFYGPQQIQKAYKKYMFYEQLRNKSEQKS